VQIPLDTSLLLETPLGTPILVGTPRGETLAILFCSLVLMYIFLFSILFPHLLPSPNLEDLPKFNKPKLLKRFISREKDRKRKGG